MAVLPILRRKDNPAAQPAAEEAASIQAARVRARRRLIGAAVLVGIGIIGFPLLFESQPRPIAVDIPIEIPSRERAALPALPMPRPAGVAASAAGLVEAAEPAAPGASQVAGAVPKAAAPAPVPAAVPLAKDAAAPPHVASRPAATNDKRAEEARRAQALLDGQPVAEAAPAKQQDSAAGGGRFVVQAGAYSDAGSLRTARDKVEKLGLKTYVQTVDTDAGKRTRLRVGPFASRDEAEKAAARIKGSGLAVNVLSIPSP